MRVIQIPVITASNPKRLSISDIIILFGRLVDLGYGIAYRVLDAQYFGVPQRRRRVFVVFQMHSEALFDSLDEAMSLQTSSRVPRLEPSRLQEIRRIFDDVCSRMERLDLPKTIVHGDINYGNILFRCGRCQFIDWCEAYVANPLISLQHLLLLNKTKDPELRGFMSQGITDRYRTIWLGSCNADSFDKGLTYMPLLAVASTLYGRGDWLTSPRRNDPQRQSYARSLARHMDHAAREPKLLEALCHYETAETGSFVPQGMAHLLDGSIGVRPGSSNLWHKNQ